MTYYHRFLLAAACSLFIISCSTTPKITSQFSDTQTVSSPSADLESFIASNSIERNSLDNLAFYVTNDENNLYIMIDIVSSRLFQNVKEFGFTVYVDHLNSIRRSFGITYPTGLFFELGNYPGAQTGYLEEPNWGNFPENRSMIEMAERSTTQNALVIQRRSRRDDFHPASIHISQLQAQNIELNVNEDGRNGRLSFTIPLEIRSQSQFAPDVKPGDVVNIGFEVNPIRLLDLDGRTSAPLITSESSSGRSRSNVDEQQQERQYHIMRRIGEPYEQWVEVRISKPED